MPKSEMTEHRDLWKERGLAVLVSAIVLLLWIDVMVCAQEDPEISEISVSRDGLVTLFGKPGDAFMFSILYSHAGGLPPLLRTEGGGQNEPVKTIYDGITLFVDGEPFRMSPRGSKGQFTEKNWKEGVYFEKKHKFSEIGSYTIFFEVKDTEGGTAKSEKHRIRISDQAKPVLEILTPSEGENIIKDSIVKVRAGDHNGEILSVTIRIAGQSYQMEREDLFDIWGCPLSIGSIPTGTQTLEVEAIDNESKTNSKAIGIQIGEWENASPQIDPDIKTKREGDECIISARIVDEDPASLDVTISYNTITDHMTLENGLWTYRLSLSNLDKDKVVTTIRATDRWGEQDTKTVPISINDPPIIGDVNQELVENTFKISVNIRDEHLDSLEVLLVHHEYGFERHMEMEENLYVYDIDAEDFKSGDQEFTILARDDAGNEASESFTVSIPKRGISISARLLTIVLVVSVVCAITGILYVTRYKKRVSFAPEGQETVLESQYVSVPLNELRRLQAYAKQSQTYLTDLESSKWKIKELTRQIEEKERNMKRLHDSLRSTGSRENVRQLENIAKDLPERHLAQLISSFAKVIYNLSDLELDDNSRILGSAIMNYRRTRGQPTEEERLAESEARRSYDTALAELKKAHGVLDVKVLEPFLMKAKELLQVSEAMPTGEKIRVYRASKKISEAVFQQLRKPEVRNRLRKLREAGFVESLELG